MFEDTKMESKKPLYRRRTDNRKGTKRHNDVENTTQKTQD